jgi:hypothetical protein
VTLSLHIAAIWVKKLRSTILILLSFSTLFGQNRFDPKYKFSKDILANLTVDSATFRAAWELSFIGEYQKALEIWDRDEHRWPALTREQIDEFSKYKPVSAKSFIIEKAKAEQIIILNEAHHQPYHRIFTTSLLEDLYRQGFRYFGAEAVWNWDTLLNKRKYPILETGFYLQEPCFGNLVREALRIGYVVFSYESTREKTDSAGINLREVDQALNIKKVLDKDPKAKILIHCGFDHLVETPYFSWGKAMAGRLTEYTGINPLTIDQHRFTEHSTSEYENPYFKMTNLLDYAVFVDSVGYVFNGVPAHKDYDARVYHPRTRWTNGRPHWIFEGGRKPFNVSDEIDVSYPCLVFAYISTELLHVKKDSDRVVPFDVIELKDKKDKKDLSLTPGQYSIVILDSTGKKQCFTVRIN